jgi:hypothetical protein
MRAELKQPLLVGQTILAMLWPVSACAAQITFGEELAAIPVLSIMMTLLLSTVMGATALLHALKVEYETRGEVRHLWLFVSARMFGSNAAGLFTFFFIDMPTNYTAATIMLAAFAGTVFLEKMASKFISDKF